AISDERFAAARAFARALDGDPARNARFRAAFPELPNAGLAGRDFSSFSVEQRALVMELLLAGRFDLALVGELPDGRTALLTHAGVTGRELAMLGAASASPGSAWARSTPGGSAESIEPRAIAAQLQAHLGDAIDRVRDDWTAGRPTPLSLEPLHVAGIPGEEGGG